MIEAAEIDARPGAIPAAGANGVAAGLKTASSAVAARTGAVGHAAGDRATSLVGVSPAAGAAAATFAPATTSIR